MFSQINRYLYSTLYRVYLHIFKYDSASANSAPYVIFTNAASPLDSGAPNKLMHKSLDILFLYVQLHVHIKRNILRMPCARWKQVIALLLIVSFAKINIMAIEPSAITGPIPIESSLSISKSCKSHALLRQLCTATTMH